MRLIKAVGLYLVVLLLLVLLVLFPRNADIAYVGDAMEPEMSYRFNWETYKSSLVQFYHTVTKDHSLGETRFPGLSTEAELKRYIPKSLKVILVAFMLSMVFGLMKGIFDYRTRKGPLKVIGEGSTWLLQSVPDFFIVLCVQWLAIYTVPQLRLFANSVPYSFLSVGVLASLYPMMYVARITYAALVSEDGAPYIQVAQSKGLGENRVLYKHILKNSMNTILTHFTPVMLHLLTSLLIAEYLTGYQGIAYRVFTAMDLQTTVGVSMPENGIIIGVGMLFVLLVALAQLVGHIVRKSLKLDRSVDE